jgi:hypothetical protein
VILEFLRRQMEETLVVFGEGLRWLVMTAEFSLSEGVIPVILDLGPTLLALAVLAAVVSL